jgi:twitching motility protein PilT
MAEAYNDYILAASLQHGWILAEQKQSIEALLTANPTLSATDVLLEQQLINQEIADWLRAAVAHQAAQTESAAHAREALVTKVETSEPVELQTGYHHVADFLQVALQTKCSDIHLSPDSAPLMRQQGQLAPLLKGGTVLSPTTTEFLAKGFLTENQIKMIEQNGSIEFCYELPGKARFRTSVVRQRRGWDMVFRVINSKVPTMEQLALPDALKKLTRYHNGLVLITGSVGSGKSTTLAAMIEHINHERHDHIITLEDPVEYVFQPAKCQISQREVYSHTKSFGTALRAALREDPDVIMVGEMRDLETISLAITASETGHLVLGTLHTNTAARTLDRLLDVFPIEQQPQIRTMVSESIRGIVCQQLVPRADGRGRALAMEIMLNNPAIGGLIRDAKTFMLPGVIQTNRRVGMQLMDDALIHLLDQGVVSPDEAFNRSENKKLFAQELARRQRK